MSVPMTLLISPSSFAIKKVGAISFIQKLEENVGGDLEAIFVRTIGIKNIHGKEPVYA